MGLKPRSRTAQPIRHAWADGWILLAVAMCGPSGGDLRTILATADYVNHAIPTYDELAEGLARLQQRGLVARRGDRFARTARLAALERKHGISGHPGWDALESMLGLERDAHGRPLPPTPTPKPLSISPDDYRLALGAYRDG